MALRKMLVENHLAAVISLPAGVFNPYSGVKTSILILDRAVAKASQHVAFFKIENDGFALGAQRKAVKGSQLAQVKAELRTWLQAARAGGGEGPGSSLGNTVKRARLAEAGDYILSGEKYIEKEERQSQFPIVTVGEIAHVISGQSPEGETVNGGGQGVPFHQGKTDFSDRWILPPRKWTTAPTKFADTNDILMSVRAPVGPINLAGYRLCIGRGLAAIRPNQRVDTLYLFHILRSAEERITGQIGAAFAAINRKDVEATAVPLPPIEVQREIVAEVESYQCVINGARAVLDNYCPHIPIAPEWQFVPMAEIAEFKNGLNFNKSDRGEALRIVGVSDFQSNTVVPSDSLSTVQLSTPVGTEHLLQPGDILFVRSNGNPDLVGRSMLVENDIGCATFSGFTIRARFDVAKVNPRYLAHFFKTPVFSEAMKKTGQGANIRNLSQGILAELEVPLPNLDEQTAIVAEIEAEQALVNCNHELIARFEKKIDAVIARVWGEAKAEEVSYG